MGHLYIIATNCKTDVKIEEGIGSKESLFLAYEFAADEKSAREEAEIQARFTLAQTSPSNDWKVAQISAEVPNEYVLAAADAIRSGKWVDPAG